MISRSQFISDNKIPNVRNLARLFENLHPYILVDTVWFIRKSEGGDRFQDWHQDLVNNAQTDITVVVNVGTVPKSKLLARRNVNSELVNTDSEVDIDPDNDSSSDSDENSSYERHHRGSKCGNSA